MRRASAAASLGCALAALLAAPGLSVTAAEPGEWVRSEATSKSGFKNLGFGQPTLLADLRPGGQPNGVYLSLACLEGVTQVALQLGTRLPEPSTQVTVAVDDREPWQETWRPGENTNIFIGLWTTDDSKSFIERVLPAERLTLQLKVTSRVATYSYDLTNAVAHVGEVAERCGWTLQ